jgi:tripeptide aminopeptidase
MTNDKLINKKRLVRRFINYVKVPSLSKSEKIFAKFIRHELSSLKIRSYQDEIGNIFADIKGDDNKAPRLLLNAHLDTVGPGEKIKPKIRYGIIISDGKTILGADNKAGIAVIIEVLKTIKEEKISHGDIQVVFTVQEEIGLLGAKAIKKNWLNADVGYVLDGGDVDALYNKAPTQYNMTAEVIGRAAHAGVHPEKGINAIKVASVAIAKMKLGRIDRETTANIGIIKGGSATNIVPDKVEIKGEARSHNIRKLKAQLKHMRRCLSQVCYKHKAQVKVNMDNVYNSFSLDKDEKVVKIAQRALLNIGIKPKIKLTGGGSDANIFNAMGIKTLIIGVGADRVHTKNERIAVDELYAGAKFLLEIIKEAHARKNLKK